MAGPILTLRSHMVSVDILPWLGGGLSRYAATVEGQEIDLLRQVDPAALTPAKAYRMSCFPMVPYANRIRDGRFRFAGQEIILSDDSERPEMRVIHGHGWQTPWTVEAAAENWAELTYRHRADRWPFAYRARQLYALVGNALSLTLEVTNLSDRDMPAGIGFHPYFPGQESARLTAAVDGVWRNDDKAMPVRRTALPPLWDLNRGVAAADLAVDNFFTGWRRLVRVFWQDSGIGLLLRGGGALDGLHVYAPEGKDFFALEPVSNLADAFNLAAAGEGGTGMRVLPPGGTLQGWMRLEPFLPTF